MRYSGGHLNPTRKIWFAKIVSLYDRTQNAFMSCCDFCPSLDCETGGAEQVLFLPYEMEFIREKLSLPDNPFETVTLEGMAYGFMSGSRNCPYFKSPDCRIHGLRPFDCRSFPILPEFSPDGKVDFKWASYCPLSHQLDPKLVELFATCWKQLTCLLPQVWKSHYNSLYWDKPAKGSSPSIPF